MQSVVLYGSETWTMRKVDSDRIQSFHMQALRRILGIYTTLFTVQGTAATKQLKKRKTTIDSTIRRTHLSDSLTTFPKL